MIPIHARPLPQAETFDKDHDWKIHAKKLRGEHRPCVCSLCNTDHYPPPSQIISHSTFSRYILFVMHLDSIYLDT
jgi:hypothetical protein